MSGETAPFITPPDFLREFFYYIVFGIFSAIASAIFNYRFKLLRRIKYYFSDRQVKINAFAVAKFDSPSSSEMDNSVFKEIQREMTADMITKQTVSPRFIKIHSKNLGMFVTVAIEDEPDTSALTETQLEILSYNIVIRMEAQIRGVKQIDNLQEFVNIADKSIKTIQHKCFASAHARSMFIVCDVKDAVDEEKNKTEEDKKNGATITWHGTTITISSREPANLVRTVKKYVYSV